MQISLSWLKDFVKIPDNTDIKELGELLTLKTAEVENIYKQSQTFDNMVVGQIVELLPHPNADKLKIAKTSIGKQTLTLVCGGANLVEGMFVAVAKVGAEVRWHGEGPLVKLERTKIRGIESEGMICAGSEIGVEDEKAGEKDILDLSAIKPKPGTPLSDLFGKEDVVLEFDNKSLTHRPDLWGHYGIAREISAITGNKFIPLNPKIKIPTKGESPKVEVKNQDLCPRYCAITINNITVKPSPKWMQDRLKTTGHGTHNNIVDVTNYVMAELGQPLHAFDKQEIKEGLVIRTAKPKEKITALDQKTYTLPEKTLVIADHEKPLAIAGVIGAKNSGINEKTTSIIIESANFNASSVRKTSTTLGIRTDSVQRFEKSLDPNLAELAIKRATELILELCLGAEIAGPLIDIQKFDKKEKKIDLNIDKAVSKIGVQLGQKEIESMLNKLEFKTTKKSSNIISVTVPSFRATKDVTMEDDLVEEIARLYGYENIPAKLPSLPTKLPIDNPERSKKHKIRNLLSYGLGFTEVYNYSFYGKRELDRCLLEEKPHLKLLNCSSEEQTHLKTTLVPLLLKNLETAVKQEENIKIYEIGRTYKEIGEYYPLEEKYLTGAIVSKDKTKNTFYEAKGVIETLFDKLETPIPKIVSGTTKTPYAHPAESGSYIGQQGQTIAKIFNLHPAISKNHGLEKHRISFFSINLSELFKISAEKPKYNPIPKFPGIKIDVSVLVKKETEVEMVEKTILDADKQIIESVSLFDIYEGPNIKENQKALAFKISLQAPDRTLTDKEMADTQQKIFQNLEKIGGEIRRA
jgi:phenylalanyl-tRNA synthetase beta chain